MQSKPPFDQDAIDPWALGNWPYLERKLIAAGAFESEITETREAWLHDHTWPHHAKQRLIALGDAKMREEVVAMRANRSGLETEAEQVLRETGEADAERTARLRAEAAEMSAYECDSILDWVAWDHDRARAALAVEMEHPRSRNDVLAALLDVLTRTRAP